MVFVAVLSGLIFRVSGQLSGGETIIGYNEDWQYFDEAGPPANAWQLTADAAEDGWQVGRTAISGIETPLSGGSSEGVR